MSALCGAHEKVHGYLQDRASIMAGREGRREYCMRKERFQRQHNGVERKEWGREREKWKEKMMEKEKKREKKIFSLLLHHSETFRIFENLFLNNFSWERGGKEEEKGNFCET